jgi:hypothetical protein
VPQLIKITEAIDEAKLGLICNWSKLAIVKNNAQVAAMQLEFNHHAIIFFNIKKTAFGAVCNLVI